jgi:hypothetical protein
MREKQNKNDFLDRNGKRTKKKRKLTFHIVGILQVDLLVQFQSLLVSSHPSLAATDLKLY